MPPKSIELSSGRLYLTGLDDPISVSDCEGRDEEEYVEDQEPYIKISQEPIEFTLDNVEFARNWTLATCKECGYQFPITDFYALLYGTNGWRCPSCVFKKRMDDLRRSK